MVFSLMRQCNTTFLCLSAMQLHVPYLDRGHIFALSLFFLLMYASREGSDETAHLRRLVRVLSVRIRDINPNLIMF